jgi:hypothetical protein
MFPPLGFFFFDHRDNLQNDYPWQLGFREDLTPEARLPLTLILGSSDRISAGSADILDFRAQSFAQLRELFDFLLRLRVLLLQVLNLLLTLYIPSMPTLNLFQQVLMLLL